MECKIKLKLTPKQLEVFVQDWQKNYRDISFEQYFDNLIQECEDEAINSNHV